MCLLVVLGGIFSNHVELHAATDFAVICEAVKLQTGAYNRNLVLLRSLGGRNPNCVCRLILRSIPIVHVFYILLSVFH